MGARRRHAMRLTRTFGLMLCMLAANVRCGGNGSPSEAADGGTSCTGQEAVCPGHPYGVCVEVQQSLGHCLDWTTVGATACSTGPEDCPTNLPAATFSSTTAAMASAVCVKASEVLFSTGTASPGYCAAYASYIDPTGASTCTPNPCGANGYCSFVHATAGNAVVSCLWPL